MLVARALDGADEATFALVRILVVLIPLLLALVGVTHQPETLFANVVDATALALFVIVAIVALRRLAGPQKPDRRRVRTTLIVSLVVPLILCPAFKYLLLVPLPMEGLVTRAMDSLRYALRTLTG